VTPSLLDACETIHTALAGVYDLPESCILDHEPYAGQLQTPLAVTVAPAGITPTSVLVTVRCYASTTTQTADIAWDQLNNLVEAVEDLLAITNTPRSNWERPLMLEVDSIILSTDVAVAREDF